MRWGAREAAHGLRLDAVYGVDELDDARAGEQPPGDKSDSGLQGGRFREKVGRKEVAYSLCLMML